MPIKKAASKDLKQSRARRERNRKVKGAIRTQIKALRKAAEKKDRAKAVELLASVVKALDTAAGNGVLKKNTVARNKSRLTKLVNGLS